MPTESLAPKPPQDDSPTTATRQLLSGVSAYSAETGTHLRRVCAMSMRLGRQLGIGRGGLDVLRYGALLHDIGKHFIPIEILHKTERLDELEFGIMKSHCEIGAFKARSNGFPPEVVSIILSHHERFDGTGYPHGLLREEIPLGARIISVVDACDTIMHERAYQHARPYAEAQSELVRCAGTQFDPHIAGVYSKILAELAERLGWGEEEEASSLVS